MVRSLFIIATTAIPLYGYEIHEYKAMLKEDKDYRSILKEATPEILQGMKPSYKECATRAANNNQNICIWVNMKPVSLSSSNIVHCEVSTFQDDSTPRLICGVPDGKGWLNQIKVLKSNECQTITIDQVFSPPAPAHIYSQPPQQFFPQPQFRGGGGGGGRSC
jgi:hypothetical protein